MCLKTITNDSSLIQLYGERDICLVKGQGSWVWDSDGKKYLDCVTGIAVNALGHVHPDIIRAAKKQLDSFSHFGNLYLMNPQLELAVLLLDLTGFDKAFFCNSGTEANEAAIKFVRKYWSDRKQGNKIEIINFEKSFHGRTYGALAATGQPGLKNGFGPMPEGFITIPVNDAEALEHAIGENTAAIIVEPILAEGGVISLSDELIGCINKAQENGVLLITDEIQTGLGRCSAFLAGTKIGLNADVVTLAKSLGGGLPLGAVLVKNKIAKYLKKGDHGTTFGGNPVACAAGKAFLKVLKSDGFMAEIAEKSDFLRNKLKNLIQSNPDCGLEVPVLGMGFLIGIRYSNDLSKLIQGCRDNGLLVYRAGKDVLRILPPLNISKPEIEQLIGSLEKTLVQL